MATTDNIQANVGPLLCFFFNNNSSPVDVYLFVLSHLHEHDIHFCISFRFKPKIVNSISDIIRWHFTESYFQTIYWG